ncbi:MAG TPA: hypothetical protein VJB16_03445, partial [archaeon]|nr:hypothetical protein [archaeon]
LYMCMHIYSRGDTMGNITVTIPDDLKAELQRHQEVNWSAVTRKAMQEHLQKLHIAEAIASRSRLTKGDIAELDALVKQGVAKAHGLC